jgi:hypothetical protein
MQPGELGWSQLAVAALDKLVALCVRSCHPVILLVLVSIDPGRVTLDVRKGMRLIFLNSVLGLAATQISWKKFVEVLGRVLFSL